ncbi:Versiconal hemiacetal acetate esterase [Penicillium rolfsii]|nr:Versiconal hemiacetal acetate esterase [Penicillium rolfsii]
MIARTEDIKVSANFTVRTYTPTPDLAGSDPLPVGLYFHGGGLCCGNLDSEDTFCRLLAERQPCVVISVGYRLAPEPKAPAQLDDALEAWNCAYNSASTLNGDCRRYFTVGQSARGNLALAVARRLIGIAAISPFVVHPDGVPSCYRTQYHAFDELGDGPVNTKRAMTQFHGLCCVRNAEADLRQFPSTYLAACGIDPLRDDGLIIHDALKTAGYVLLLLSSAFLWISIHSNSAYRRVPVKLDYDQDLPHVFWALRYALLGVGRHYGRRFDQNPAE